MPVLTHDETCPMQHEPPIEMEPDEKLRWLRRLDGTRHWQFLNDRRFCRCCGKSFTGQEVEIVGGTRPHGPLRATCPTQNCSSAPADWVYLHETAGQVREPVDLPVATAIRVVRTKRAGATNGSQPDGAPPHPVPPSKVSCDIGWSSIDALTDESIARQQARI